MIKFVKAYSRERSLMYAYLWYVSDTKSILDWLGIPWDTTLYMQEPGSDKISIWYGQSKLSELEFDRKVEEKLKENPEIFDNMLEYWQKEWEIILPYLSKKKEIETADELEYYYNHLVSWWSPMNVMFFIPNLPNVPQWMKKVSLEKRKQGELYSDSANDLIMDFIKNHSEELRPLATILTPEETFSYFKGKKIDLKKVRDRFNGYGLLNGKLYSFTDLKIALREQDFYLDEPLFTGTISGSVAHKGKVDGTAKIILIRSDLSKISPGDILVAEMTSPDYVPFISKVAAIITDEGGLTCHAAIIAREMKKPCIIGTKIATKVLKDGDRVEVDADNGIVRILNK